MAVNVTGGVWFKIDMTNLREKFHGMIESAKTLLSEGPDTPGSVAANIVARILEKAPSEQEEFNLIMYGVNGMSGIQGTATVSERDRTQTYTVEGRQRFIREPGMWIHQAIVTDVTTSFRAEQSENGVRISFGDLANLNRLTRFSYVDARQGKFKKAPPGEWVHETPYGMFSAFEYGTTALGWGYIIPSWAHLLVPTDYLKLRDMVKEIPAFSMYSEINRAFISGLVRDVLDEAIEEYFSTSSSGKRYYSNRDSRGRFTKRT